ncbi:MAG: S8 family serine peptidase [Trueperaceae bacterium]
MSGEHTRHAALPVLATRAGRVSATLKLIVTLALTTVLAACNVTPRLETSADDLAGAAFTERNLVLRNAGGGTLRWQFSSDNPHVSLRNQFAVPTTGGALGPGAAATLHIVVNGQVADPLVDLNANLHFDSNGGSRTVPFSTSAVGACQASGLSSAHVGPGPVPVGSQILVSYHAAIGPAHMAAPYATQSATRADLSRVHGLTTLEASTGPGPDVLVAPEGADVDALVARLAADPRVAAAQRNYYVELQWNGGTPSDPYFPAQWALTAFGVPAAWAALSGEPQRQVVVAVIDSGVQSAHPDLASKILPGFDFFRNSPVTDPAYVAPGTGPFGKIAHGTHVAGIAAAAGDATGIIGVAFDPSVKVLPVKVFDDCATVGRVDTLVKGILWAAGLPATGAPPNPNPAQVINLSLGLPGRQPVLDHATTQAFAAGALVVAASGNHRTGEPNTVLSPANGPDVLAVGSVNEDRSVSAFSNFGAGLDVVAPGGYAQAGSTAEAHCAAAAPATILSTVPYAAGDPPERGYACLAGTSMAAPFVAGVAALLLASDASLTAADVRGRLIETALFEPHMSASHYGAGLVCADRALGAATQCGAP